MAATTYKPLIEIKHDERGFTILHMNDEAGKNVRRQGH